MRDYVEPLSSIFLRPAEMADWKYVKYLYGRCFQSEGPDPDYIKKCFRQALRDPQKHFLEVAHTTTPIAFCAAGMRTRDTGIIKLLGVDEFYRGKKLAMQLLERVCNNLTEAGAADITLHVSDRNSSALRLYRGYGFTTIQQLPNGYGAGRGAYEMSLNFGN